MRESLSSGHFSTDQQVSDVLWWLRTNHPAEHAEILREFPDIKDIRWELSHFDTEAMGVDEEWPSWLADALERTGLVYWEDGEPWAGAEWTHDPSKDGTGCCWCGAWAQVDSDGMCEECFDNE